MAKTNGNVRSLGDSFVKTRYHVFSLRKLVLIMFVLFSLHCFYLFHSGHGLLKVRPLFSAHIAKNIINNYASTVIIC